MASIDRKPRLRAVQQRAEETQASLLRAGIELFSTRGYDGTSIRDLESLAGVKRGLAAYHFGSKEELWKAVAAKTFEAFAPSEPAEAEDPPTREHALREGIRAFVRFSAAHPELNRLMVQEAKAPGWRLDHLVEHFVRPRLEGLAGLLGRPLDPHELYILVGAATFVFNVEYECEALFGVNPRQPPFADAHADLVVDLLTGAGGPFASRNPAEAP